MKSLMNKTTAKTTSKTTAWKRIVASLVMAGVTAVGTGTSFAADYVVQTGTLYPTLQALQTAHATLANNDSIAFKNSDNTLTAAFAGVGKLTLKNSGSNMVISAGAGNPQFLTFAAAGTLDVGANSNLTIKGFGENRNDAIVVHGAIVANSGFTLTNNAGTLTFDSNIAKNAGAGQAQGGAIWTDGPLNISNTTFTGNEAKSAGGARGGAIQVFAGDPAGADVSINKSIFSGNKAIGTGATLNDSIAYAGGVQIIRGNEVKISNSTFSGNIADTTGLNVNSQAGFAGMHIVDDRQASEVTLNKVNFINNEAKSNKSAIGGGLGIVNAKSVSINGGTFSGNKVTGKTEAHGAALWLETIGTTAADTFSINGTTFEYNIAENTGTGNAHGGAVNIYTNGGLATPVLTDATFFGNQAIAATGTASGGAIFTDSDLTIKAVDKYVLFWNNYTTDSTGKNANDIHVAGNKTLTFDAAPNKYIILDGGITGDGKIVKTGAGNLAVAKAVFDTMNIDAGTLMVYATKDQADAPLEGIGATHELKFGATAKLNPLIWNGDYSLKVGDPAENRYFATAGTTVTDLDNTKIVSTNPLFSTDYDATDDETKFTLTRENAAKVLPQLSSSVADALNNYEGNNSFLEAALNNTGKTNAIVAEQVESGFNMTGRAGTMRQTLSAKNLVVGASRNIAPQYVVSAGGNYRLPPNHPSNYAPSDFAPIYNPASQNSQETSPMAKPEQLTPPPQPKEGMQPHKQYPFPALPSATRGQAPSVLGQSAFWCAPLYGHDNGNNVKSGGVGFDYAADQYGLAFGVETIAGGARVGIASAIGWSNVTSKSATIKTTDEADFGSIYGFFHAPLGKVDLTANLGWLGVSHYVRQDNSGSRMNASVDTGALFGSFGIERTYHCGGLRLTPSVGIECNWLYQDAYRTLWGAYDTFRADKSTAATCAIPIGLRANRDFFCGAGIFTPEIRARYIPNVGAKDLSYTNTTAVNLSGSGANPIKAIMKSPITDAHAGDLGLGLTWKYKFFEAGADYNVLFSQHFVEQNASGVARWKF